MLIMEQLLTTLLLLFFLPLILAVTLEWIQKLRAQYAASKPITPIIHVEHVDAYEKLERTPSTYLGS